MAGLYRRATAPNFTSPAMQVAASRGAAGAIPGGGVSVPRGQQGFGMDMGQLGGMLGLLQKMKDKQDPAAAAGVGNPQAGTGTTVMPAQQIPGGGVGMNPANMPLSGGGIGNAVDSGMGTGMNGIPGTGGMPGGAGGLSNPMTGGILDSQMLQNMRFFTPGF